MIPTGDKHVSFGDKHVSFGGEITETSDKENKKIELENVSGKAINKDHAKLTRGDSKKNIFNVNNHSKDVNVASNAKVVHEEIVRIKPKLEKRNSLSNLMIRKEVTSKSSEEVQEKQDKEYAKAEKKELDNIVSADKKLLNHLKSKNKHFSKDNAFQDLTEIVDIKRNNEKNKKEVMTKFPYDNSKDQAYRDKCAVKLGEINEVYLKEFEVFKEKSEKADV